MDLENIEIMITIISAIAICVLVCLEVRSQKFNKKIIKNKPPLEIVHGLISQLQKANSVGEHASMVSDDEFEKSMDLSDVPSKMVMLIQYDQISEKIIIEEWNLPIENLSDKISMLIKIRDNLL